MVKALRTLATVLLLACAVVPAHAQEDRSYRYTSFDVHYQVNSNATVRVEEHLTYAYTGEYHQGYRSLPHAGSDAITDISVVDAATGKALSYSSKRLDKLDPHSWGSYTTYTDNGATAIEWYYDLADTTHTWVISYTLHGAVTFYQDHDELYWNLFSGLDAPVNAASATVTLPGENTDPTSHWYLQGTGHEESIHQPDARNTVFTALSIPAGAPATIALGWQKGLVSKGSYWLDWLSLNWAYVLCALILAGSGIFCFAYWFITEKYPHIGEVIIPEYEPPRGLPPLEGELVMRESLSARAWPATVVDLAVRGHLTITELPGKWYYFGSKYYELRRNEGTAGSLRTYERSFLDILFSLPSSKNGVFSTLKLSRSTKDKQTLYGKMKGLEEEVLAETDRETKAFSRTLAGQKRGMYGVWALVVALSVLAPLSSGVSFSPYLMLTLAVLAAYVVIRYFTKYEARLSPDGEQQRKDWLGFKLYLQTAERYRLQNLTPDLFEKYLPYAMIFKIEKQWAKAFDGLNVVQPAWFVGAYGASGNASGMSGFSASSFASSFSASFSSSFASSGGSGASGGGGSAGGGGGGGGGGAS